MRNIVDEMKADARFVRIVNELRAGPSAVREAYRLSIREPEAFAFYRDSWISTAVRVLSALRLLREWGSHEECALIAEQYKALMDICPATVGPEPESAFMQDFAAVTARIKSNLNRYGHDRWARHALRSIGLDHARIEAILAANTDDEPSGPPADGEPSSQ